MAASARRVLITGANRGIGLEFVRQYLSRGDHVVATTRDPQKADELNQLAREHGDRLQIVPLDVASDRSIEKASDAVASQGDALDVLINNAGVYGVHIGRDGQPTESIGTLKTEEALSVLHTNAVAPLMIVQAFIGLLKKSKSPRIVNITSGYGSVSSNAGDFPYYCRGDRPAEAEQVVLAPARAVQQQQRQRRIARLEAVDETEIVAHRAPFRPEDGPSHL